MEKIQEEGMELLIATVLERILTKIEDQSNAAPAAIVELRLTYNDICPTPEQFTRAQKNVLLASVGSGNTMDNLGRALQAMVTNEIFRTLIGDTLKARYVCTVVMCPRAPGPIQPLPLSCFTITVKHFSSFV